MASLIVLHHLPLFSLTLLLTTLLSLSSSHPHTQIPTLSSSPTILSPSPSPSSLSPFQELSPDIAPLLPSPGGALPTPTGSDIPTIPSSPSPPNPDDDGGASVAPGPLSAFSPFGMMQASSNSPAILASATTSSMAVFAGLVAYCVMQCMRF